MAIGPEPATVRFDLRHAGGVARTAGDYLDLRPAAARNQWRQILRRPAAPAGARQVAFVPVETLLCLAAMLVVEYTRFGSGSAARAPEPVQHLARVFQRPPTSIIAKMNNIAGTRAHGAKFDTMVGAVIGTDHEHLAETYRVIVAAARAEGIGDEQLPDFLQLERGGDLVLLGQDELTGTEFESVLEKKFDEWTREHADLSASVTEKLLLASVRIGQHRFAHGVLDNCGRACMFCGFALDHSPGPSLLRASHIKPWSRADDTERLDVGNGVAACPTHDAAFDAGLLTLGVDLTIRRSPRLEASMERNPAVAHAFRPGHLRTSLPSTATPLGRAFIEFHYAHVWHAEDSPSLTAGQRAAEVIGGV